MAFRKFRDLILNVDPALTIALHIPDDPSDNIEDLVANGVQDHRSVLDPIGTDTSKSKFVPQRETKKAVKWADQNSVDGITQQPHNRDPMSRMGRNKLK